MNIFPTDSIPYRSARALDDKRLVRQASEAVLILSTAASVLGIETHYKPHQPDHLLIQWIASSRYTYAWTFNYALACNELYTARYGKVCKAFPHLEALAGTFMKAPPTAGPLPQFHNGARHNALGIDFTGLPDASEAYRQYLNVRWQDHDKSAPVWSAGQRPDWATCTR